jgi:hypothetical protein
MSAEILQLALQFGNGSRLEKKDQDGMGKFGMGLPSASISQARKVEIWSWQNGIDSAMSTYLDVSEIISGEMTVIPIPAKKLVPGEWKKIGGNFGKTGTLIVWTGLDRCIWKTGDAIINNSEFLIGRMYRKFLEKDKVKIRMAVFDGDSKARTNKNEKYAKPNDPLYLIEDSSTPSPFNNNAMFTQWPDSDNFEIPLDIKFHGQKHTVFIRMAMAKLESRSELNAGNQLHGQHAAKNIGLSVLRAGRELELDPSWANWGERRDRWWGIEVEFPPALDELFGVTNNKQFASHLSEMSKVDVEEIIKSRGKKTIHELKDDLEGDDDHTLQLLELTHTIRSNIALMQKIVYAQNKTQGRVRKVGDLGFAPEKEATDKTKERQLEGILGVSDEGEKKSVEERKEEIKKALEVSGLESGQAEIFAGQAIDNSLKYLFVDADIDTPAFFSVQPKGGTIVLTLNTNHPAYQRLVDVLEKDVSGINDVEILRDRLLNALDGLKLLLMAWARYEDEQVSPQSREKVKDSRQDWGRVAKRFMEKNED